MKDDLMVHAFVFDADFCIKQRAAGRDPREGIIVTAEGLVMKTKEDECNAGND